MSTLEKALGAATAAIAVLGAAFTVLGIIEAGVIAAALAVLYGLFLLAQLLREARRQKRAIELLRESGRLSRQAIADARLESIHAQNDILDHTREIRDELKDTWRRSNSRIGGPGSAVTGLDNQDGTEPIPVSNTIAAELEEHEERLKDSLSDAMEGVMAYQQVTAQKLVAQQDGLRHMVDLVRGGLADLDASASATGTTLGEVERSLDDVAGRDQLDGVAATLTSQQGDVEQLSVRLTALQDELAAIATLDAVTAVGSTLGAVEQEIARLADNSQSLSEQVRGMEQEIDLLIDNSRGMSEQVLGMNQRVADAGAQTAGVPAPSMVDIGERMEALRDRDQEIPDVRGIDIDVSVAAHKEALERLRMTLQEVRSSETLLEGERQRMLSSLYAQLGMQDVKQEFVLDVNAYGVGVSFRAQMVRLIHLKESLSAQGYEISPRENDKMRDRAFATALGIPTPPLLFHDVPTSEVALEPNSIIKPMVGESSRGVFYVRSDLHLISLRTKSVYATFPDAATEYEFWQSASPDPRWMGERAVLDDNGKPGRDIKAFMFYGRVGLFREVVRFADGESGTLSAAYDETGRRIAYRDGDDSGLDQGIPEGLAELATELSLASPVPFLRIDFLIGADGPVLGEVTPHPGGIYAGDAYDDVDRRLGQMFLEADARLTIDLLNGKDFGAYFNAYDVRASCT